MAAISGSSDLEEYRGNCHCGGFKFTVKLPVIEEVESCQCSICTRLGYMEVNLAQDQLVVLKGGDSLREYEFGEKSLTWKFCPICGTTVMLYRKDHPKSEEIGLNIRTLDNFDIEKVKVRVLDGPGPPYQPPQPRLHHLQLGTGQVYYQGNCHCGAVSYTLKSKPIKDIKVMHCNCSLCSRNGDLWIYPSKGSVTLHGEDKLTDYIFLHDDSLHAFCSICGISVVVRVMNETDDIMPINVRTINGLEWDKLQYQTYDGRKNDPQYNVW